VTTMRKLRKKDGHSWGRCKHLRQGSKILLFYNHISLSCILWLCRGKALDLGVLRLVGTSLDCSACISHLLSLSN
jgi:hypothetical protein